MKFLRRWMRRLSFLFRRGREWSELDDEMRFHLEMEAQELMSREGLSAAEARRRALVAFGGVDRHKERVRGAMGTEWLETLVQDVRYGLRGLVRSPGFTSSALVVLALGIGATTAIFQVVNAVILRPLPYPRPDRLVRVYQAAPIRGETRGAFSLPNFRDWRERTETLSEMGLYSTFASGVVLTGRGPAAELKTTYVAGAFFSTLGVAPARGRTFGPEADEKAARVVVLSHDCWVGRFGGDPSVVGTTVTLDQQPFEVVGVMPRGFSFPAPDVDVWVPITVIPASSIPMQLRFVRFPQAVGRMKAGVTPRRAQEELSTVAAALAEEYPKANAGLDAATVVPLRDVVVGQDVERALLLVMGAVAFILLIACTNVANLLLARGQRRRRELAVRMSLGASSGRVVRQLLTESVLLAALGSALGVAVAWLGGRFLLARSTGVIPRAGEVTTDGTVLGFALLLALVTTALFGALPALRAADLSLGEELKEGGRGGSGAPGVRLRRWLVAGQVAVAVVLLVGAGLLIRSLDALTSVDPGFRTEGLATMTLTISDQKYPERADFMGFYHEVMAGMGKLPGVEEVASIRAFPLKGGGEQWPFSIPGIYEPSPEEQTVVDVICVSSNLFHTMGIRLLSGRTFTDADGPDDPSVVVVNQAFADRYMGGENPVGTSLTIGGPGVEVVGMVENVRQRDLGEDAEPAIYVHQEQLPRRGMAFVARVNGELAPVLAGMRQVVLSLDPDQAITELAPVGQVLSDSVARPRFFTILLGSFAALALILSALGIYGVIAYVVRHRVREVGLRMALGAGTRDVTGMVLRQGMAPALGGLAAGLALAFGLSRVMGSLLFGVTAADPATYVAVAAALAAVAALACLIPALNAARVDPMRALRSE